MKKLICLGVAGLLATSVVACSSNVSGPESDSGSAGQDQVDTSLTKLVPEDIAKEGSITAGANFQAPPFAQYASDGKTPSGAMVDLVTAAGHRIGLDVVWKQVGVTDQIPALQAGKIVVSGTATAADEQIVKQANVVGVLHNQQGIFSLTENADSYQSITDVCGKSVGVGQAAAGTIAILDQMSDICVQDGKGAIKEVKLSGTSDIVLAVQSGRTDTGMLSTASIVYTADSNPSIAETRVGADIAKAIPQGAHGFIVAKDQEKLAEVFQKAVDSMIKDGSYAEILGESKVPESLFFDKATLNDASVATEAK